MEIIGKITNHFNLINNDNILSQENLIGNKNKQILISLMSKIIIQKLDDESYYWLMNLLSNFAESSFFSDFFLNEKIKQNIFGKSFYDYPKKNIEYFQFLRSFFDNKNFLMYYSSYGKVYEIFNKVDVANQALIPLIIQFLFVIEEIVKSISIENEIEIYEKMKTINALEKIEKIDSFYSDNKIIRKKCSEIKLLLNDLYNKHKMD